MVNIVPKSWVTHTPSRSTDGAETDYGSGPETYDEDFGTYYGLEGHHSGDGSVTVNLTDEHTWTDPRTIYRFRIKSYWDASMGNYPSWNWSIKVYLRESGTWTEEYSLTGSGAAADPAPITTDQTVDGEWADVTGIKVVLYGYAYSYEGDRNQYTWLYMYETEAFYKKSKSYSGVVT